MPGYGTLLQTSVPNFRPVRPKLRGYRTTAGFDKPSLRRAIRTVRGRPRSSFALGCGNRLSGGLKIHNVKSLPRIGLKSDPGEAHFGGGRYEPHPHMKLRSGSQSIMAGSPACLTDFSHRPGLSAVARFCGYSDSASGSCTTVQMLPCPTVSAAVRRIVSDVSARTAAS